MSVEKQSCDSTADAVKQGDISKPLAHGDIWQTDMSERISEAESFSTEGKESGKNVGTGCPDASYSMVRRWFENLDNFERISALSFIDGPFLATLFTFASSWSETMRMEGDDVTDAIVNWQCEVSMEKFESLYLVNRQESSYPLVAEKNDLTKEKRSCTEETTERAESDAIIIQSHSPIGSGETVESTNSLGENEVKSRIRLFDQVCIIFPTAFRHISGISFDERSPLVTIRPYNFDSAADLLSALDLASTSFFGHPFLDSNEIHEPLMPFEPILLSLKRKPTIEKVCALGAFLLVRFEAAVTASFCEAGLDCGLDDNVILGRRKEMLLNLEEESSRAISAPAQETKKRSETENLENTSSNRRIGFSGFLGKYVTDFTIYSQILVPGAHHGEEVLQNATDLFLHALEVDGVRCSDLGSLLFPPMSFFLSFAKEKGKIDFLMMDELAIAAYERLVEFRAMTGEQDEAALDVTDSINQVGEALSRDKESNQETQGAVQKKKKRKPRKRKGRRSSQPSSKNTQSFSMTKAVDSSCRASCIRPEEEEHAKGTAISNESSASMFNMLSHTTTEVDDPCLASGAMSQRCAEVLMEDVAGSFYNGENNSRKACVPFADTNSVSSVQASKNDVGDDAGKDETDSKLTILKREEVDVLPAKPGMGNHLSFSSPETLTVVPTTGYIETRIPSACIHPEKEEIVECSSVVHEDDSAAWEKVEIRGRCGRKKVSDHCGKGGSRHSNANDMHGNGSRKAKGARTPASRKKVANRRIAREIISSILDKVDDEVRKKKPVLVRPPVNPWKLNPSGSVAALPKDKLTDQSLLSKPEKSLRDIVVGARDSSVSTKKVAPLDKDTQRRPNLVEGKKSLTKDPARAKTSPPMRTKGMTGTADQNTAPTYQETVSAVSTPSNAAVDSKGDRNSSEDRTSKADSSYNDTDEVPIKRSHDAIEPKIENTRDPPLPTLLSPENAQSANSSVASSLEVPHTSHSHRHHSASAVDDSDVGYHLLDVCDKLTRDMSLFMSRRTLALSTRRRERGALLAALQDIVSRMWSGRCHVEMYGSCATQLDLPSSDIDVVVVGLDRNLDMMMHQQSLRRSSSQVSSREIPASKASANLTMIDEAQHIQVQRQPPVNPYVSLPLNMNGERVVRLAAELETMPWAVRVNAIPTASVPVVKVLCDPSRLNGASSGGEWMAHHQHLAAQAAAAAGHVGIRDEGPNVSFQGHFHQQSMLPWRGSDVMNGLLSLDITFEGPEHGGIGSTEFSAHVVAEACQEAGVHPDATPLVQVLMVLKELLAQRKLNEPYSGGLSSYALLLLVVALIRERSVIREEIEKVERQRKAMVAGDSTLTYGTTDELRTSTCSSSSLRLPVTLESESPIASAQCDVKAAGHKPKMLSDVLSKEGTVLSEESASKSKNSAQSSWASIAKKQSNALSARSATVDNFVKAAASPLPSQSRSKVGEASAAKIIAKPSFADAVSKSASVAKSVDRKNSHSKKASVSDSPDLISKYAENSSQSGDNKIIVQTIDRMDTKLANGSQKLASHEASLQKDQATGQTAGSSLDSQLMTTHSYFSQGFNDVVEVLCSGQTTAGKLLMHFLLYYGQHFDAQTTAIDLSGKHERNFMNQVTPYPYISPYIQRRAPGSIDPVTGMLTIDPIVIYDPLEGAENNNVARRCFAWNSVRWIFAQSYATLSSAVERSATPPVHSDAKSVSEPVSEKGDAKTRTSSCAVVGESADPSSPLLRCLLSF